MSDAKNGPVLIELDTPAESPATAPPVPEPDPALPEPAAMQIAARLAARRPSRLGRWFWGLAGALVSFVASIAAWNFVTTLLAQNPVLGLIATVLVAAFLIVLAIIALRELAAFARLRRVDRLQSAAEAAAARDDLEGARGVVASLKRLYRGRDELAWGLDRLAAREGELFDADGLLALTEAELIAPLDLLATREIEAAARQVATVTAIVPIALADLATALTANIRMIRRIAEVYGGRSGALGSWRLTRAVLTHLVATGAVAVGDDLIGSLAGGSVLSKLSRRFGEGVVNGALTARVGVAAMEVCRPLPFVARSRPSVTAILSRALAGVFDTGKGRGDSQA
ncbi:YcjF family protein [Sinisalibacter aestuarii]|uniref:TIGR01620 family protein n=1 Tax=Sinisalibacter aestuarii TaxID=2949426 RepID=A0ABQ5LQL0_9RHOB|nr:TIGR01620 family protein [Sinisalibacter aestuarii]GKY87297.1 TIGR01620 family protein [Sinisalibacter aestuarii]